MMKTKLNEAFPIVAAALGNNLGVRVMVTGQTALTDGEMIVIPAYDGEDPNYRDVAWGYLAHDVTFRRRQHEISKVDRTVFSDVGVASENGK